MSAFYSERAPSSHLQPIVDCYWRFHASPDRGAFEHIVPPDGSVSVAAAQGPGTARLVTIVGPSTKAQLVWVQPGWHYAGIRLMPGAAGSLLRLRSTDLQDQVLAVGALEDELREHCLEVGAALLDERFTDLEAMLNDWLGGRSLDPVVSASVREIREQHGACAIAALAERHGLSERHFRRRFEAATGLSPKEYARMVQLRHACVLAVSSPELSWSSLSAEAGYADQPHLVRAVAKSFGITPGQVGAYLRQITHDFAQPAMSEKVKTSL